MDPSGFVVGKCPKNWLLSVVSGWKGSEGLFVGLVTVVGVVSWVVGGSMIVWGGFVSDVVSILSFFGSKKGSMLNFSAVVSIEVAVREVVLVLDVGL